MLFLIDAPLTLLNSGTSIAPSTDVDILVLAGQSNAEGAVYYPDTELTVDEDAIQSNIYMISSDGTTFNKVHPSDITTTLSLNGRYGLESVLASYVSSSKSLYIVKSAKSGAAIATLLEGSITFDNMITRWNGAINILTSQGKTIGNKVLWWAQGEKDSHATSTIVSYPAQYDTMMASFRSLMGNDIKIVNNEMSIKYPTNKSAEINSILKAKADGDANIFMLKNTNYPVQVDNAHFTGDSLRRIAGYLYDVITKGDMIVVNDSTQDMVLNTPYTFDLDEDNTGGSVTINSVTGLETVTLSGSTINVAVGGVEGSTNVTYTITKGSVSDTATITLNSVTQISNELGRGIAVAVDTGGTVFTLSNATATGFRLKIDQAGTDDTSPLVKFPYDYNFLAHQAYLISYDVTNISGTIMRSENLAGLNRYSNNIHATNSYTYTHYATRPYGFFTFHGTQLGEIEISNLSITPV